MANSIQMGKTLDGGVPSGPLTEKWDQHRFDMKLINPANRRRFKIIMVGTGLAGASAAASLGEMGYNVEAFFYQDSARRAHSVAAQGGINGAKNYRNDGDSVFRLFYDTIPLPVSTAGCWTTALLAAHRSPAPSTPEARLASSFYWEPTRPWSVRSTRAQSNCTAAAKCSIW
jgi:hypothetical protein